MPVYAFICNVFEIVSHCIHVVTFISGSNIRGNIEIFYIDKKTCENPSKQKKGSMPKQMKYRNHKLAEKLL